MESTNDIVENTPAKSDGNLEKHASVQIGTSLLIKSDEPNIEELVTPSALNAGVSNSLPVINLTSSLRVKSKLTQSSSALKSKLQVSNSKKGKSFHDTHVKSAVKINSQKLVSKTKVRSNIKFAAKKSRKPLQNLNKSSHKFKSDPEIQSLSRELAKDMLEDILVKTMENVVAKEIDHFVLETLCAITEITADRKLNSWQYIWIIYFHLQYSDVEMFVAHIQTIRGELLPPEGIAKIIVDLVEEVAEYAEYLDETSDDPDKVAKNLVWKIINASALKRRYDELPESEIAAGDLLDDILREVYRLKFFRPSEISFEGDKEDVLVETDITWATSELQLGKRCDEYGGVYKISENFIDSLIETAIIKANEILRKRAKEYDEDSIVQYKTDWENRMSEKIVLFPKIEEFNFGKGVDAIESYICCWDMLEDWTYAIDYLMAQSDEVSDFYLYEVIWSLPTALYPIAQATASVFFTLEVMRIKPSNCTIDLTYKFEGNSLLHRPFEYPFHEQRLLHILEAKLELYKHLTF